MKKKEILEKISAGLSDYIFYPDSIKVNNNAAFLIGKNSNNKYLFIVGDKKTCSRFMGDFLNNSIIEGSQYIIKRAPLTYDNMLKLRILFPYIKPVKCNKKASFGTGDRLGLVTAAHIKAFENTDVFPVLAQQSVRELSRTKRTWKDVMASAMWGYFESGSCIPFGADADHVKEREDLKEAVDAGFTMFTIDPSDHILELSSLLGRDLEYKYQNFKRKNSLEEKYLGISIKLGERKYYINEEVLMTAAVKYEKVIEKVIALYGFLKSYLKELFDFEISMDEIDEPVTPFEHYFVANELKEAGVMFNNLALRYPGRWEKAIDYMGSIKDLEVQLKAHVQISEIFGDYKLSLHSGSEKFSAYKTFSRVNNGNYHIKTSGTSYLEVLRAVVETDPELFRDIYTLSLESFEVDRSSYHLTTDTSKLKNINKVRDHNLKDYLNIPQSRQILHVAFGSILTNRTLKERLYRNLLCNESFHYRFVRENIRRHLDYLV